MAAKIFRCKPSLSNLRGQPSDPVFGSTYCRVRAPFDRYDVDCFDLFC